MSKRGAAVGSGTTLGRVESLVVRASAPVTSRLPATSVLARLGLGAMLVLAGVHKLVAPSAWTVYVANWLLPFIVVSPTLFMLVNGVLEVVFGGLLLVDRFVVGSAFVAAVSLPATVAYLAVVGLTEGLFVDVLIRDVGLTALAWVVLVDEIRKRGT